MYGSHQIKHWSKTQSTVGLTSGESDIGCVYFASINWPRTISGKKLLVGSTNLRLALADALCTSYTTEDNFWTTKLYVIPCTNAVMDLRTPLRMRGQMLDPDLVNDTWFQEEKVAVERAPKLHVKLVLSEVKPDQPESAKQLARELVAHSLKGRDHFIAARRMDFIASVEHSLAKKGVNTTQSQTERWTPEMHHLQGVQDHQIMNGLLRINSVIVQLRLLIIKGLKFHGIADMVRYGGQLFFNGHLRGTKPGTTRTERKKKRLEPPCRRRGFTLYRCDGAARGQGGTSDVNLGSGWGAVCYGNTGQDTTPEQVAWGWLDEHMTNNEAEYIGLLNALQHTLAQGHLRVCYQLDSLLVVNQACGKWACRSASLETYYSEAIKMIENMEAAGATVIVEHIYREYNKDADKYANVVVDLQSQQEWHCPQ